MAFPALLSILGNIVAGQINSTLQDSGSQQAVNMLSSFIGKSTTKNLKNTAKQLSNPNPLAARSQPQTSSFLDKPF